MDTYDGAPPLLTISTEKAMARRSEIDEVQRKIEAEAFWESSIEPVLDAR